MPVTAKLSREFYDRFGDEVANELVELLNRVDSEYRSELRQQNELNFARFDAKLEQRVVELAAKMDRRFAETGATVDKRFADLEAKMDKGLAGLDAKIDKGLSGLDAKIDKGLSGLDAKIEKGLSGVREDMAKLEASVQRGLLMQSRWMLAGWAAVMIAILLK